MTSSGTSRMREHLERLSKSTEPFTAQKLGTFTYKVLFAPTTITMHLRRELHAEWLRDRSEHPDQPWTPRWLNVLEASSFALKKVRLADVKPLAELMAWKTENYDFQKELVARLDEAREALRKNPGIEPLVMLRNGELVDGYMRYSYLKEVGETDAYAYVAK